jgi:hypothetical protein
MPEIDYNSYGFKNSTVDKLSTRAVFNPNKMPVKRVAQPRDLQAEAKLMELAKTMNAPDPGPVLLGDGSAITYVAGAAAGGVKAIMKAAAKKLTKKAAIKGASKASE